MIKDNSENMTESTKSEGLGSSKTKTTNCIILMIGAMVAVMLVIGVIQGIHAHRSAANKRFETQQQAVKPSPTKSSKEALEQKQLASTEKAENEELKRSSKINTREDFLNEAGKLTSKIAYNEIEGLLESRIMVADNVMAFFIFTEPMTKEESLDIADAVLMMYPAVCAKGGAEWIVGAPWGNDYTNLYDPYNVKFLVVQRDGTEETAVYKYDKPALERFKIIPCERKRVNGF